MQEELRSLLTPTAAKRNIPSNANGTRRVRQSAKWVPRKPVSGKVLISMAKRGDARGVQGALASRCDVNAVDTCKQTALIWAASQGKKRVVEMLIAAKADPHRATSKPSSKAHGWTAAVWAKMRGHADIARRIEQYAESQSARALLSHPASLALGSLPSPGDDCVNRQTITLELSRGVVKRLHIKNSLEKARSMPDIYDFEDIHDEHPRRESSAPPPDTPSKSNMNGRPAPTSLQLARCRQNTKSPKKKEFGSADPRQYWRVKDWSDGTREGDTGPSIRDRI